MSYGCILMVAVIFTGIPGDCSISKYGNKHLMYGKRTGNQNNRNVQRRSSGETLLACQLNNGTIVTYVRGKHICCNGLLKTTSGHTRCCRGTVIDGRVHQCCDNAIVSSSDGCCPENICCNTSLDTSIRNTKCCGNAIYNNTTHMCCHGNIQPAHGPENNRGACCHNTSYHIDCHTCYKNTKLIEVFDVSTEICCGGKVIAKNNSSSCCQNILMNIDSEECRENKIVRKADNKFKKGNFTLHLHLAERTTTKKVSTSEKWHYENRVEERDNGATEVSLVLGGVAAFSLIGICAHCFLKFLKTRKSDLKQTFDLTFGSSVGTESPFSRVYQDKETNLMLEHDKSQVDCYIPTSIATYKPIPNTKHFLEKQYLKKTSNLIEFYIKDDSTQTIIENQTFPRTIFGQPYEHMFMLDDDNPSLEIPGSDVKMRLPKSFTQGRQVEVHCSCFHSLPDLRKKLNIPDDEELVSPVSEFDITGCIILPEHARVMIPFIGKECDLIVKKFQSDEGLNTVAKSVIVPKKTKENADLKLFYTVEGKFVIIHTHSFSGFYCTKNRHKKDVDLSLRAFIFGCYRKINRKYSVDVSVYIADEIFELKAYQKDMLKNEKDKEQLKDILLCMPRLDLDEQDFIETCLLAGTDWIHRMHPKENRPIQPERKELRLEYIAQKCTTCTNFNPREVEIPFHTEWYLTAKEDIVPSEEFEFTVDLNICKRGTDCKEENSIYIASLPLRKSDRLPVKEDFIGAMAPSAPVQESCKEQSHLAPSSDRMHGTSLVRGERSQTPVHSFSESDLPRAQNRQLDTRQQPGPELSAPYVYFNSNTS